MQNQHSGPISPTHTPSPVRTLPSTGGNNDVLERALRLATWENPANLKMVVVNDFEPCCSTEVKAYQGQYVTGLFQNGAWVYVRTSNGKEGFLPSTVCIVKPSIYRPPSSSGVSSGFGEDDLSLPGVGRTGDERLHQQRGSFDNTDSAFASPLINGYQSEPEKTSSRVTFALPKGRDPWQIGHGAYGGRPGELNSRPGGPSIHQWRGSSLHGPTRHASVGQEERILSPGHQRKVMTFPLASQDHALPNVAALEHEPPSARTKRRLIDRLRNFRHGSNSSVEVFQFDGSGSQPSPRGM